MPHSLPSQHGYKQGKSRRAGNLITASGPLLAVSRGGLNIFSAIILPLFGYTIRTYYIFSTYVNFQINISRTIRYALQRMLIRIYH